MSSSNKQKSATEYDFALYEKFRLCIEKRILNLLRSNGFENGKKLYISVSSRAKTLASSEEKLGRKKINLNQVSDLAGCRVIFYLERDLNKFRDILVQEFDYKDYQTKYEKNDYKALHLSVKLKGEKLTQDTKQFEDLWCEVQLTTGIYHVWSEVFHDWHYKPTDEIRGLFPDEYKALDNLAQELMEKQLVEGQKQIEHLLARYETLDEGRKVFSSEFLNSLREAKNTEELFDGLKVLKENIEKFGNRTASEKSLLDLVDELYKLVDSLKIEEVKTPWGQFDGKSHEEIKFKLLEIIDNFQIRYESPEKVINYYAQAFSVLPGYARQITEFIESATRHNPNALQKYGFAPQLKILAVIEGWTKEEKIKYLDLIAEVGKSLLNPSFQGSYLSDYNQLTLQMGSIDQLPFIKLEQIQEIRGEGLRVLEKVFQDLGYPNSLKLFQVLQIGTYTPNQGHYSEEFKQLIIENAKSLISWYKKLVDEEKLSNEELQEVEEHILSMARVFTEITQFEDFKSILVSLKANTNYQTHRSLVGYSLDMIEEGDYQKVQEKRHLSILKLAEDITLENYQEWVSRMQKLLVNYDPIDLGKYQYFFNFLENLGRTKPNIAIKMAQELVGKIEVPFLESLLVGIYQAAEQYQGKVLSILDEWFTQKKHLILIARILSHLKLYNEKLLQGLLTAGNLENTVKLRIFNSVFGVGVETYPFSENIKSSLFGCVQYLTEQGSFFWTDTLWLRGENFLKSLTASEWEKLLALMEYLPVIDYREEKILSILATQSPKRVIKFFKKRTVRKKSQDSPRYDAVPFRMDELAQALALNSKAVLTEILTWFDDKDALLSFEAAHLFQRLFPNFDKAINLVLKPLLAESEEKANIVLAIMEAYDGQSFLDGLAKEYLKLYGGTEKNRRKIIFAFSQTGTSWGEYGIRDKYAAKLQEINNWSETDKNIQQFLKEYKKYLEETVRSETKRSDDMVDAMQRDFKY